jgi:hypothetical protein
MASELRGDGRAHPIAASEDITPFGPVLNQLTALQPVHYSGARRTSRSSILATAAPTAIARDVEAVLPELVVTGEDGFKAVDYAQLPLLTIQAVKELKRRTS